MAFMRISAVCFLVLGAFACHDAMVLPASRFVPALPGALMLGGPFLMVLGVVLLVGSFLPRKAAKPMIKVGISLAILGGLPLLAGLLSPDKGANSWPAVFMEIFLWVALPFVFVPGLALVAAGSMLAAVERRSAKPLIIVGVSLAILGGVPLVVGLLSTGNGANSQTPGFMKLFLFTMLPFVLVPGLALVAAGGVLAAVERWSGNKTAN